VKNEDLHLKNLQQNILPPYVDRANADSARFLLWFWRKFFALIHRTLMTLALTPN